MHSETVIRRYFDKNKESCSDEFLYLCLIQMMMVVFVISSSLFLLGMGIHHTEGLVFHILIVAFDGPIVSAECVRRFNFPLSSSHTGNFFVPLCIQLHPF